MSRLWSRFGARTAAVALLSVGVAGGFYLGEDRQTQQQGLTARVGLEVDQAEYAYQRDRQAEHRLESARQRAAEYQAKLRAAAAAKEAAQRAKEAEAAAASRKKAREAAAAAAAAAAATKPYAGPIPTSCGEYSGNRQIGCAIMLDAGFAIDQFPCLDKLWTKESGWNHKAYNESSGAYGIPQALPGSKMGSVAADWKTNPATQIKWGLGYIEGRYDTPCGAWQHSQSTGWY